jgi:acyl-CoA hydrolase
VVSEYGVASLKGKHVRQRVEEVINIAHPDFRDWLRFEARKMNFIP